LHLYLYLRWAHLCRRCCDDLLGISYFRTRSTVNPRCEPKTSVPKWISQLQFPVVHCLYWKQAFQRGERAHSLTD
jgi:hypothetical protein